MILTEPRVHLAATFVVGSRWKKDSKRETPEGDIQFLFVL